MADTHDQQARTHFEASSAFIRKAEVLLSNDLIARQVLSDSISATKNMLQGYLLVRVSKHPNDPSAQYWQEVAASNRLPELLRCCRDAGLNLNGIDREIRRLNDERNRREHDDPRHALDAQQSRRALEVARDLAQRINASVRGGPSVVQLQRAAVTGAMARIGLGNHAASRGADTPPALKPTTNAYLAGVAHANAAVPARDSEADAQSTTAAPAPSAASGATNETPPDIAEAVSEPDDTDDAIAVTGQHSRRALATIARALLVAALIVVGALAGAGVVVGTSPGPAPSWMAVASSWLPGGHAATRGANSTTARVSVLTAGVLSADAPVCAGGKTTLILHNTAAITQHWAITSPDDPMILFALPQSTGTSTSLAGTLQPGASVPIAITGVASGARYHVAAFGPGGTIDVYDIAC